MIIAIFGKVILLIFFIWAWMVFLLAYFSAVDFWKPIAIILAVLLYRRIQRTIEQRSTRE